MAYLFDEIERTIMRPAKYACEDGFLFLNTWGWRNVGCIRSLMEEWIAHYPQAPDIRTGTPVKSATTGDIFRKEFPGHGTLLVSKMATGGFQAKILTREGIERIVTPPALFDGFHKQVYDPVTDSWRTVG